MDVLIVGASVRAAAASARRAGLRPHGIDLFADWDTRVLGPCRRIAAERYPAGIVELSRLEPAGPWLYTGALENHPELLERLARVRPLWGNRAAVVRAVRDPFKVAETLRRAGLPAPGLCRQPDDLPRDGSWLAKPLDSAGGRGIRPLDSQNHPNRRAMYFQERVEGIPLSAVYLATESGCRFVGATWQWVGIPAAPFAYRGSIGPFALSVEEQDRFARLGQTLTEAFGLVGLFGIDLILRDAVPWPVEVNPRYTASVEVLELALGRSLLAEHAAACGGGPSRAPAPARAHARFVGKAIVYAEFACRFPEFELSVPDPLGAVPDAADLPHPGTRFEPGDPVLTVFACGASVSDCRDRLERQRNAWTGRLEPVPSPAIG